MEFFQKSPEEALKDFNVNKETGLTEEQVLKNREKYGKNEFSPAKKVTLLKKIIDALKDPMLLILLIAAFITIGMNFYKCLHGMHAEFTESIGIITAIVLSVVITIVMEGRSEKAFQTLNSINEDVKVKVIRDGVIKYIYKKDVVAGDIIKIQTGDKAPADGRLIDSLQLKVDESMLTGESKPASKDSQEILTDPKAALSDRRNMIFAGTFVTYGQGTVVITSVGDNTEMGNIASELKRTKSKSTPLQEKLKKLANSISAIGIVLSLLIFLYEIFKIYMHHHFTFDTVQNAFMTSVALTVAAVPEGLPTIVAMTLALNIIKMAKSNALVRKLVACETIGCINVICSDKTGTLTKNQMTVMDVWDNGKLIKPKTLRNGLLLKNFAINSTADINTENGKVKFIGNPTECSLLKVFNDTRSTDDSKNAVYFIQNSSACESENEDSKYSLEDTDLTSYRSVRKSADITFQYPFSSDKKSMTTVVSEGDHYRIYSKGSPEKIISLCNSIIIDGKIQPFTGGLKEMVIEEITNLQKEAKRILGFSHKDILTSFDDWGKVQDRIESDMIFDGFVSITDPLRDDVFNAVSKCKNAGINLKILTGDNIVTARSIAKQLYILDDDSLVVEAQQIDEMSDDELEDVIDRIKVIARSKPLTKMRIVNLLKERGNVVAVTGDGINDAPALKNADVGIAMGITGTEVSKEASDIILLDDSFSTILKAVEWGRGIYENFQRFIQFQLTVNLVAVSVVIICEMFGFDVPFTTIQLLWVNLIMDGPPALSLGLESLRDNLMDHEPIKRDASIITKDMFIKIILNGLFIIIMVMLLIGGHVLGGTPSQQSSIVFTAFVVFQLFNSYNARELGYESIFKNLTKNKPMLLMMGITFLIQIIITQFGGKVFNTAPLSIGMWVKVTAYCFTVILFSEFLKLAIRTFKKAN